MTDIPKPAFAKQLRLDELKAEARVTGHKALQERLPKTKTCDVERWADIAINGFLAHLAEHIKDEDEHRALANLFRGFAVNMQQLQISVSDSTARISSMADDYALAALRACVYRRVIVGEGSCER